MATREIHASSEGMAKDESCDRSTPETRWTELIESARRRAEEVRRERQELADRTEKIYSSWITASG